MRNSPRGPASANDATTLGRLQAGFGIETLDLDSRAASQAALGSLGRVQRRLFNNADPPLTAQLDDQVAIFSAPGESRECVEIVRRTLRLARAGVSLDRIAVLLRSPQEYRSHLEEAFGRANLPVYFTRGAVRPDPAGRASHALLCCAADRASSRTMLAITIVCAPRSPEVVDAAVIFGALMGAIVWNLITWWLGIPSSSSHALIGGLASSGKVSVLRPLQSFFRPATTRI